MEVNEENSYPSLEDPHNGAVYPSQDQSFLQWLFSFRKESIVPLRNVWRGREYDFHTSKWIKVEKKEDEMRIMNERGITWAISLIESYMSPAFIVSDFDESSYNFTMREVSRVIWNNLALRYGDFELRKSDIPRVAEEIESKIRAVILGARDNGYRDFFSTQNQNIETRNLSPVAEKRGSIISGVANLFRRNQGGQQQQQY